MILKDKLIEAHCNKYTCGDCPITSNCNFYKKHYELNNYDQIFAKLFNQIEIKKPKLKIAYEQFIVKFFNNNIL